MTEKTNYKDSFFLSISFIVSGSLALSLIEQSTLHFLNIYNQNLSRGLGVLALAGLFVFSERVYLKLYRRYQYLILFSNLVLIGIGTLLLLAAIK